MPGTDELTSIGKIPPKIEQSQALLMNRKETAFKTNKKKRVRPIDTVYTVFRLLPGGERVEFPLEELEDKCQEVGMKLYQRWQSRSRERVTRDLTGHAITEGIHAQRQRLNIQDFFFFHIY